MNYLQVASYLVLVGMFVAGGGWYLDILQKRDRILARYGDCVIEFANDKQLPYNQQTWEAAWSACGDINKTAN